MFTRLSLRFRIFLFFCLLAAGGAALAGGAMYLGWSRAQHALPSTPFLTAFVIFAFLNTGLAVVVWLLFDENIAKPINKLAADLRLRAHSGVDAEVETEAARYLGDLAPAANAVSAALTGTLMDTASQITRETQRLKAETERLTALLTEIPLATILVNAAGEIVLYDGQAADVLSAIAPPRLKAPLTDYFDPQSLASAKAEVTKSRTEISFILEDHSKKLRFDAKLKALETDGYMLLIDVGDGVERSIAARPLVFDFDLLNPGEATEIHDTALRDLCFVAFDTETTGLSIEKDDVVQLGAVRVLKGRIVQGEVVDTYVNPGRPIPPASTVIHKVTDADVAAAPDFASVGRSFYHFAQDAVLVAHNAPFDIGLLRRSEKDIGVTWSHPVLDTVLLSAVVFGTTEDHSLDALCARLSIIIPPEMRHTAIGDARATAEVLVKLIPLLEAKGLARFGQIVSETQRHGRLLQDLNDSPSQTTA